MFHCNRGKIPRIPAVFISSNYQMPGYPCKRKHPWLYYTTTTLIHMQYILMNCEKSINICLLHSKRYLVSNIIFECSRFSKEYLLIEKAFQEGNWVIQNVVTWTHQWKIYCWCQLTHIVGRNQSRFVRLWMNEWMNFILISQIHLVTEK